MQELKLRHHMELDEKQKYFIAEMESKNSHLKTVEYELRIKS